MLEHIIRLSLSQRLLTLLFALLLAAAGSLAWLKLPIDAFPDVSSTQVKIIMKAPGMTPEEVEARITTPIETEMLGIPGKTMVRSVSKYALADITLDFADGTDIYRARNQVTERLNAVLRDLPAGASGGMAPITTPLGEMLMFTIDGGNLTLEQRRSLLDWVIRPALRTLPGVADVNALGGMVRSFEVIPDSAAMQARNISMPQLRSALELNNRNDGAGRLNDGEETLLVRVEGAIKTLDDIRATVVSSRNGQVIRIGDIATVRIGALTRYGAVTQDGRGETVEGLVLGLRGANARQVVDSVQAKLNELAPSLPPGVKTNIFYNRGALVEHAVSTVSHALIEAIALVLVLLLLFLGHLRAALVVATALPLAALATFILMLQFGMSANLMSLGGLAIAIGMLVDAAVVVVENIVNHLGHESPLPTSHRIFRAVREVSAPVLTGVVIIIVVFLPLLALQGLEGKLFIPVALTIVFALASSLLVSLTIIPVLASLLLQPEKHSDPWLVRHAMAIYDPLLRSALAHPGRVVAIALILALAAGIVYPRIGKTFMPTMDEGDVIISLETLPSIGLKPSIDLDMRLERALMARVPEIRSIVARTGSDELGLDPMGLNQTDTFLVLKPRSEWRKPDKEWLIGQLRDVLKDFPGISYNFTQPIEMRVAEMIVGVRGDVAVKVFGPDLATLNRLAGEVATTLRSIHGSQDVYHLSNDGVQYLQVHIDRLAAGRLGLDADAIEQVLHTQLEGVTVGTVLEGNRRTPLLLRGRAELQDTPAAFAALRVTLPDGQSIPLSSIATLERSLGPVKIDRENASRFAVVQTNVNGRDLVGFVSEAQQAVAQRVKLPPGYHLAWGGQFENQQRAAARLGVVVPVALAMIFLLLFFSFGSVRQALLVFANIPFALVGGIFGLWLSGDYLSVPASVGFIALLGIAVLNGVVMVSYFNQLRASGMSLNETVLEGARRRLRPVLMTASITAFGLVPLLFASGPGSEIQKPLAIVVIGGLFSSTPLTLILLPLLYRRMQHSTEKSQ